MCACAWNDSCDSLYDSLVTAYLRMRRAVRRRRADNGASVDAAEKSWAWRSPRMALEVKRRLERLRSMTSLRAVMMGLTGGRGRGRVHRVLRLWEAGRDRGRGVEAAGGGREVQGLAARYHGLENR